MNLKRLKNSIKRNFREVWYYFLLKNGKLLDNVIFYESFFGRGLTCNPYALFLEILEDERFSSFKHVWSVSKDENHDFEIERFKNHQNVIQW